MLDPSKRYKIIYKHTGKTVPREIIACHGGNNYARYVNMIRMEATEPEIEQRRAAGAAEDWDTCDALFKKWESRSIYAIKLVGENPLSIWTRYCRK